jgi:hypothetical protein
MKNPTEKYGEKSYYHCSPLTYQMHISHVYFDLIDNQGNVLVKYHYDTPGR